MLLVGIDFHPADAGVFTTGVPKNSCKVTKKEEIRHYEEICALSTLPETKDNMFFRTLVVVTQAS